MRFAVSTTTHLAAVIVSIALGSPGSKKEEGEESQPGLIVSKTRRGSATSRPQSGAGDVTATFCSCVHELFLAAGQAVLFHHLLARPRRRPNFTAFHRLFWVAAHRHGVLVPAALSCWPADL